MRGQKPHNEISVGGMYLYRRKQNIVANR